MNGKRFLKIDFLRGLAIFFMILIHTTAYFRHNAAAAFLWDFSQWAVPVFIFCSAYVYFRRNNDLNIKKRVVRLIGPYYVFLVVYFLLNRLGGKKFDLTYIVNSITVTGGVDLNWLVLLFLMLSVVMPFIKKLTLKHRLGFYAFTAVSLLSSIILVFFRFPYNYRLIMWLPWSLLIIFAWAFVKYENNRRFMIGGTITSLFIFLILRTINANIGNSLIQFDNKYPPNLYHISYGVFFIFLFYLLAKTGSFNFLSRYSYSLFFIHFLAIFSLQLFVKWQFNWISFFGVVFGVSIFIQWLINVFLRYIRARQSGYWPVPAD